MGLFNFLKRAGKSLGLGADEAPTPEMLQKEVADLGLDAKGAEITVDGDKVTVSGGSLSAEEREKTDFGSGQCGRCGHGRGRRGRHGRVSYG